MLQARQTKKPFEGMGKKLVVQNEINLFDGVFEVRRTLGVSCLPNYLHVLPVGNGSMCHRYSD